MRGGSLIAEIKQVSLAKKRFFALHDIQKESVVDLAKIPTLAGTEKQQLLTKLRDNVEKWLKNFDLLLTIDQNFLSTQHQKMLKLAAQFKIKKQVVSLKSKKEDKILIQPSLSPEKQQKIQNLMDENAKNNPKRSEFTEKEKIIYFQELQSFVQQHRENKEGVDTQDFYDAPTVELLPKAAFSLLKKHFER